MQIKSCWLHKHKLKKDITEQDVVKCQQKWIDSIKNISNAFINHTDYVSVATKAIDDLYAYNFTEVLFKPTKAAEYPFRPTKNGALSYFIGGDIVDNGYNEDKGFAINSGKCWSDVVIYNHQIDIHKDTAIAMGVYTFTCATTHEITKVEYTFGYKLNPD